MSVKNRWVRLVYASLKSPECNLAGMPELLKRARAFNHSEGITGILCFSRDRFLQCLEGPPEAVNALYARILRDPRHCDVMLLDYREIMDRSFGTWSMGYLFELERDDQVLRDFFARGEFDPHLLNGTAAVQFLKRLAHSPHPGRSLESPGANL